MFSRPSRFSDTLKYSRNTTALLGAVGPAPVLARIFRIRPVNVAPLQTRSLIKQLLENTVKITHQMSEENPCTHTADMLGP